MSKPYEEILDKYEATHLMIKNSSKLNVLLEKDENYEEIYKDENFRIYEKLDSGYSEQK